MRLITNPENGELCFPEHSQQNNNKPAVIYGEAERMNSRKRVIIEGRERG